MLNTEEDRTGISMRHYVSRQMKDIKKRNILNVLLEFPLILSLMINLICESSHLATDPCQFWSILQESLHHFYRRKTSTYTFFACNDQMNFTHS